MEERTSYVYVLIHVEENKVFYVGRATQREGKFLRWADHQRRCNEGSTLPVYRKIRKINEAGHHVKFQLRCTAATYDESVKIEKDLIAAFGLDNLTNVLESESIGTWRGGAPIYANSDKQRANVKAMNARKQKKVWVKQTIGGAVDVYNSVGEAAEALKIDKRSLIYRLLTNTNPSRYRTHQFIQVSYSPLTADVSS